MGLTIQDGKLVLRDGALGTDTACCCGGGCCCIDGSPDETKTTQAACEEAGGAWTANVSCDTHECPGCCCVGSPPVLQGRTQAQCDAEGGTWYGATCEEQTIHCICEECAPANEDETCPDGFLGPDYSGPCWSLHGLPCYKAVGNYQDCSNCQPTEPATAVWSTEIPCDQWAAYEPYIDANPFP